MAIATALLLLLALVVLAFIGKYNAMVTLRKRCWEARQEICQTDLLILARANSILQGGDAHTHRTIACDIAARRDDFEVAIHRAAAMLHNQTAVERLNKARRDFLSCISAADCHFDEAIQPLSQAIEKHKGYAELFNRTLKTPAGMLVGGLNHLDKIPTI